MDHSAVCAEAIKHMERTVHSLAALVPAPVLIELYGKPLIRYQEQTIRQAIILKLARLVSNINAAQLLLDKGYVQEQGAMQRMLDEGDEDITFLTLAVMSDDITDLHKQFLAAFWMEEFDNPTPLKSTQNRPSIPRRKINAWIARHPFFPGDESTWVALSAFIMKTYSGYVHGAAPHIMDLYGGEPPRFHMRCLLGTPRHDDHSDDLLNYYHRAIAAFAFAANAFDDDEIFVSIRDYSIHFSAQTGKG
jgi:hypothetical protein